MTKVTPRLLISSGEPAGIGPDLCLQMALQNWACPVVVMGDPDLFRQRADQLHLPITLRSFTGQFLPHQPGTLDLWAQALNTSCQPGQLNAANAPYVIRMLESGTDACLSGQFTALITAPVQKSILSDAGFNFTGHTEFLQQRCGVPQVVMMLAGPGIRVALATTHLPLHEVATAITPELLSSVLKLIDREMRIKFGLTQPRIAVCGLNPHAGESGHLGHEEIDILQPVLQQLRAQGLCLLGPLPADTAFTPRHLQQCDVTLAMYHDQGLPVLKYATFGQGVNITLGLPIIRTSVDHGTALDLAGKGGAEVGSLIAAMQSALAMTPSGSS